MKPIEPGCLAIIKTPRYFGWPVRVICRSSAFGQLPDGVHYAADDPSNEWIIESLSSSFKTVHNAKERYVQSDKFCSANERVLMRIDDDSEQITEHQKEAVTC